MTIPSGMEMQKVVGDALREMAADGKGMDAGIQNLAAGLATSRDKSFYSEYGLITRKSQEELERMYRGAWLPRKIIDTITEDMTREWLTVSWDGHDDEEGGGRAIAEAERSLGVRTETADGVRWGALHGGAGIIMRMKNDGLVLGQPLDPSKVQRGDLVAIKTFDRWFLSVDGSEIDDNPSLPSGLPNRNYGFPTYYQLSVPGSGTLSRVHASRIVRFNGAKTPLRAWIENGFWDDSVLLAAERAIKNYDATTSGIASMVWESTIDVVGVTNLAQQLATKDGEAKVTARFIAAAIMKSFNKMLVIDKDKENYSQKTVTFAGLKDVLAGMMNDVAGAAGTPLTRLYGQSPAGLNATGESDTRNHYDHIKARQGSDLRPQVEKLYEVLVPSALGARPKNVAITFNSLWQPSDKEKAEAEKTRAETRKLYWDMGALNEGGIARELHADGTMKTMEDKDVQLAEELALEPDPEPIVPVPGKGIPPGAA
jgi:phage-related protein (TIGR01555 family)